VEAVTRGEEAFDRGEYLTHEQVGQRLQAIAAALMQVRWSLPAAEDLARICERIEIDNPEAARRVAGTIYDGCARLKDFRRLARASSRMAGRRELVFPPLPYTAVYQVTDEAVEISRIFHGAQDWP
jgi:toxin ParE1/3/4